VIYLDVRLQIGSKIARYSLYTQSNSCLSQDVFKVFVQTALDFICRDRPEDAIIVVGSSIGAWIGLKSYPRFSLSVKILQSLERVGCNI